MSLFAPDQHNGRSFELLPTGLLTWARLEFDEFRNSTSSEGGRYANMIATVQTGQFRGRKLFFMVCDIFDARNSKGFREMAFVQLKHICEALGLFQPQSPTSYARFDNSDFQQIIQTIIGMDDPTVPIKITFQKGKDGYEDKNGLDFLSPNENSPTAKSYKALYATGALGEVMPAVKAGAPAQVPAAAPSVFGGSPAQNAATAVPPAQQPGGWLPPGVTTQAAPAVAQTAPVAAPVAGPVGFPPAQQTAAAQPPAQVPMGVPTGAPSGQPLRPF